MLIGIKGLVLRVIPRTESDRLVVLFTAERGKITVCAKGSRSAKSKLLPCIEPFAYSEFVLYEKDGYFWIREGLLIENFYKIREDVTKLAEYGALLGLRQEKRSVLLLQSDGRRDRLRRLP